MVKNDPSQTVLLGQAIRERRKQLGMTQEELAEKLGIGHQAMSRIEHGHIAPKMDRLPLIANSLQCTVADLFRQSDSSQSSLASRIADVLSGLSSKKQEYIFQHISSLAFLLKIDE